MTGSNPRETGEQVHQLVSTRVVVGDGLGAPLKIVPARIEVTGSRISGVFEASASELAAHPQAGGPRWHDFGDKLVSPAWVNGHVHLAMAAFRGIGGVEATRGNVVEDLYYRLERALTLADIRAFTRLGAYESLLAGVGFVWEHYYGGEALAAGLRDTGLAGVVAPTLQDLSGPGVGQFEQGLRDTEAIAGSADLRGRGIYAALGPHATDTVSAEAWHKIRDYACKMQLPIHAHVAQSYEEFARVWEREQATPVGFLERAGVLEAGVRMLLVHGLYLANGDLGRLDASRHVLGFCPFSQLQFGFCADASGWAEAGLPWCVATDCAASNDSMNVQKELRLVAGGRGLSTRHSDAFGAFLASGALAEAQAVQAHRAAAFVRHHRLAQPAFLLSRVWGVPGAMHPQVKVGVLEVDALANILVWDPQHPSMWPLHDPLASLAMGDTSGAIDSMMVAGRWIGGVGQHRELVRSAAYREARCEADRRLVELMGRLG
ncbi:MAG: amidohydrolase family protein [Nannocystaceae bacterium]